MGKFRPHSLLTTTQKWTLELLFRALHPQFELKQECRKRQQLTCDRVDRLGNIHASLTRRMRRCRHKKRCSSGACEICMRIVRMRLIYQASLLFQELLEDKSGKTWVVSAVDHTLVVEQGCLDPALVIRRMEAIRQAIGRSDLALAHIFAGLDASLNFELDPAIAPTWWLHFYFVVCTDLSQEQIRNVFMQIFPAGPGADDPVHVKFAKKSTIPTILSYAIKARFTRRIPYLDRQGIRRTRKVWLKADQSTELAIFLDQLGVGNRLLFRRLKITKGTLIRL